MAWSLVPLHLLAQATPSISEGTALDSPFVNGLKMIAILVAVFVLPFFIGRFLAKQFKMPTHAASMGIIIATITGCLVILATNKLRYGIDIVGGTELVYELDREALREASKQGGVQVTAKDLLKPLSERINPAGTKEISIRPSGSDKIEVVVPDKEQMEVEEIKRMISQAGILEFKIVANTSDHGDIMNFARKQAANPEQFQRTSRDVVDDNGKVVGIWREIGKEDEVRNGVQALRTPIYGVHLARDAATGRLLNQFPGSNETNGFERWLQRQGIQVVELLLALERGGEAFPVVTGSDIANARVSTSQNGGYEVAFSMRNEGARKLSNLTLRNQPDVKRDFHRQMAILLDNRILSAPNLNQPISNNGVITGNFTRADAEFLQKILQSGSLPAALNKVPISENQVGAEMGRDAISKGFIASIMGLITTSLFMLVYYRFSGIVACIALAINLLIVLAAMVIIRQPITLPGLAGLILSVGMSVDANVLVFERIREEIAKRSTGRLAIRNGFDRAITTIIDSNLTTLISAVMLYWFGTDQVRGFAITLIIGLAASMFTAVFCSRVIFEVCERLRLVRFGMFDIVAFMRKSILGNKDIDFMSMRKVCYAISAILMLGGVVFPFFRGAQILDIDFRGGTKHVFVLDKEMSTDDVRALVDNIFTAEAAKSTGDDSSVETTLTNVEMEEFGPNRVYKLVTSLRDVNKVTKLLVDGFNANPNGAKLLTYQVETTLQPTEKKTGDISPSTKANLVAFQEDAAKESAATENSTPPAATEAKPEEAPAPAVPATDAQTPPAPATETPPAPTSPSTPNSDGSPLVPVDGLAAPTAESVLPSERTNASLTFQAGNAGKEAKINASGLLEKLVIAGTEIGLKINASQIQVIPKDSIGWTRESDVGYSEWSISLPLDAAKSQELLSKFEANLSSEPIWQSVSKVDSRVADEMQTRALLALCVSLVCICVYIWFRFQKLSFGLAALIALLHDVFITLAAVAVSHWLFRPLGFLLIDDFKISLTMVAAFLTIIGYSLNDTIVVFDRIREVKGKAPRLTSEMINQSVNQTLGRTLLTSATTIFAIFLMYIFGGEALHPFCFAMLIGIVVGTYSSIFVAAPLLLWFSHREDAKRAARVA